MAMNDTSFGGQTNEESDLTGQGNRRLLVKGIAVMLLLPAIVLFGASGRLNWGIAWIYIGITAAITTGSRMIMLRKNPDLIAERAGFSSRGDIKPWDKALMPIVAIIGPIVTLIVIGLDMRFTWSPRLPTAVQVAALALTTIGYFVPRPAKLPQIVQTCL
jgi:hypothetical protein